MLIVCFLKKTQTSASKHKIGCLSSDGTLLVLTSLKCLGLRTKTVKMCMHEGECESLSCLLTINAYIHNKKSYYLCNHLKRDICLKQLHLVIAHVFSARLPRGSSSLESVAKVIKPCLQFTVD